MKYYMFTFDAIEAFMRNSKLQSVDFEDGLNFYYFLLNPDSDWKNDAISLTRSKDGIIFHTGSIDKKKGLLFDLTSFDAFEQEKDDIKKISAIVVKVLRYAVKFFNDSNAPSQNERYIRDRNITLVYPYHFSRTVEVPKVVIDINNWNESKRKDYKFLTVFSYETKEGKTVSYTSLSKAVKALNDISVNNDAPAKRIKENAALVPYSIFGLNKVDNPLDSNLGADNWNHYLTEVQKKFISRQVSGPERLEGAAGTGKTLSMCLRVINLLDCAERKSENLNIIYFTHSESTKEQVVELLHANHQDFNKYMEGNEGRPERSVKVVTLQEWCATHLGINELKEEEFLDKDAGDSKLMQLYHIEEAWEKTLKSYWGMFEKDLSKDFKEWVQSSSDPVKYEMLQREFSEIIKGQARGTLDSYLSLERPKYGIALKNETDKRFLYQVFRTYSEALDRLAQFDSDDIVISALGQVQAPIWNRRRRTEGYDVCFIDETQLFNLNEISVFHYVNKPDSRNNIIFCIDRAQCVGDSFRADKQLILDEEGKQESPVVERFNSVFRSSPDVAALSFSILTSGAAMFNTFENPMEDSVSVDIHDYRKSIKPKYFLYDSLDKSIEAAFSWAQNYCDRQYARRSGLLFVATNEEILNSIRKYADHHNKPISVINGRGDRANISKAINDNRFVVGGIDYIGGLEFDAVVIVGIDKNNVPRNDSRYASHIINYAWFNRLYVAVTRARYTVAMFGEKSYGISPLLETAISDEYIELVNR